MSVVENTNTTPAFSVQSVGKAIKSAYYIVAAEFVVLTIIVGNLIKGAQGVGFFSLTSNAVKQALAAVTAARAGYESVEAAVKAATIFNQRSKLFEQVQKPNPSKSLADRVKDLTKSCEYIKDNGKTLHKTLKVAKNVLMAERANKVLEGLASEDESVKNKALDDGEKFVKTIRRRVNLQLGFSVATTATRVGAFVIATALVFTAANPVTLTLSGVVGLGILVSIIGQKIMIPSNPFDKPDESSKLQTVAFKIRECANRALDRLENFVERRTQAAA
ncbi:MAG: hypothetical protein LLF94_03200 [Chlamydiales bacterium]|nr:hypothetical protein [Chlamydiales bacterium]